MIMYRQNQLMSNVGRVHSMFHSRFKTSQNHLNEKYQFLHKSELPTMYFQSSLPRLPIPKLENTCERYLAALRPILNDENYHKTVDIVNKFKTSTGLQLQKMLKDSDARNKHTSYISEPWFDMYLRDRVPLPINYNPILVMKRNENYQYNNQLIRATNLVISSLRFMRALRAGYLEPEVFHLNPKKSDTPTFRKVTGLAPSIIATYVAYMFKAFPLDMSQYNGLFGATRIPEIDKDRIYRNDNSKHLIVMNRGNFFSVDVLDADGNIEAPDVILGRLKYILQLNNPKEPHPLGVLTTCNRNKWADFRRHLIELGNQKSMELIDSGLFCLCLDDAVYDLDNPIPLVKDCLAGDGKNRWFDKSFTLSVSRDGTTALNFEHSWGDGVAVLRFFNEIYNETTESPIIHPNTVSYDDQEVRRKVRLIEFKLDDRLKKGIQDASRDHNKIMDSLDVNFLRYNDINKMLCKYNGISPDSVMQLAFQLAYRQLYGKYVGTYESCSTAAFKHGRTETMRPCTMATKEFCENVLKRDRSNNSELRAMIEKCSTVHGNLTKEAAMGQGFDRHLFGLKHIAEENGLTKAGIFEDSSYETINYNIISTSTLSSPGMSAGGFGPVVKDGLGIGYTITNDLCGTLVTSYKNQRDGGEFIRSLVEAFNTIRNILYTKKV